jgi:hypothetical protein
MLHLPVPLAVPPHPPRDLPVLSRIQNIGYELGENGRTSEWYRANHRTPCVAEVNDQQDNWMLAH